MDVLAISSQIGLQSLLLLFILCFGYCRFVHWVSCFSVCETPGWLPGLKNVTRASVDTGVGRKWVKFQFWAIYPFNTGH